MPGPRAGALARPPGPGQRRAEPGPSRAVLAGKKLGTEWFELRAVRPGRYNRSMSATEKLAISLPKDLIEKLRREDDWRDARATLDRIFERCPGPEAKHYAWARQVLGVGPKPAA